MVIFHSYVKLPEGIPTVLVIDIQSILVYCILRVDTSETTSIESYHMVY